MPVNELFQEEKNTGRYKFLIWTVVWTLIKAGATFVIKFVIFIRNTPLYVFNTSTSSVQFLILMIDISAVTFQIKAAFCQNLNAQRSMIFSFSLDALVVMKLRKINEVNDYQ